MTNTTMQTEQLSQSSPTTSNHAPSEKPAVSIGDTLPAAMRRLEEIAARCKAETEAVLEFAKQHGKFSVRCARHDTVNHIDEEKSVLATREAGAVTLVHRECRTCLNVARAVERNKWMLRAGVPEILLTASWETWTCRDPKDESILKRCEKFAGKPHGVLILSGESFGTGKSFAAVCVMKHMGCGLFREQATLLSEIRNGYGNNKAQDIITRFQQTKLLVLDDVGTGAGYRDELPLLHEILNYRHGNRKKTILTTNLDRAGLAETLGERMADRFRESAVLIEFKGASRRPGMRSVYEGEEL